MNKYISTNDKRNIKLRRWLAATSALLTMLLSGCTYNPKFQTTEAPAEIYQQPSTYLDLLDLPVPKGAIPVSVYSFRDQTGQYKPQQNVSSFSTAVTQGAASILVEALTESRWFLPLEREGLQNILTERKIIRAAQKKQNRDELSPLATASILLEGGIISYDSNNYTAGSGLGYYGVTAGEQYRQDRITVYLRAIDVRSGQVLVSVSTSKTILSQEIRAGFYRFVSLSRLAEAESGYSTNEPMHTCVVQAVQKAVSDLVIVGVKKGVWSLKNPTDTKHRLFYEYEAEKANNIRKLREERAETEESGWIW